MVSCILGDDYKCVYYCYDYIPVSVLQTLVIFSADVYMACLKLYHRIARACMHTFVRASCSQSLEGNGVRVYLVYIHVHVACLLMFYIVLCLPTLDPNE